MAVENLRFPDVYIDKQKVQSETNIPSSNGTIGALIGFAERGEKNKAIKISSWNEYLNTFAKGLETPFLATSNLAYAVYGFFQNYPNGIIYVVSATDGKEKFASGTIGGVKYTANDAGTLGNKLFIEHVADAVGESETPTFTVNVYMGDTASADTLIETFAGVTAETIVDTVNAGGKYGFVNIEPTANITLTATAEPTALTGGDNGGDPDYESLLPKVFDTIFDVSMIASTDDMTEVTSQIITTYCTSGRKKSPVKEDVVNITSTEQTATADTILGLKLNGNAALVVPWVKVNDPITGGIKAIPPVGHYMGIVARYGNADPDADGNGQFGVVPAGTSATVNGIVGLVDNIDTTDTVLGGDLNVGNVIMLRSMPTYGIVVWGARTKAEDGRYINSLLLETMIGRDAYDGLQPYVFKPNNDNTWRKVKGKLERYMRRLFKKGNFEGNTEAEAFRVICDSSINTPETIKAKELHAQIAYREKDCAEFIIVHISRSLGA